ncbi:MAG: hypothetical protein OEN01_11080, partial [Candidatus Krumholzibacteria bacterium]|nr:hypothetical protein [Candidatus Krumholzibacteria bacterium]
MRKLIVGMCLALLVSSCAAPSRTGRFARSGGMEPNIRALLDEGAQSYRITADDGVVVRAAGGVKILESAGPSTVLVRADGSALRVTIEPDGSVGAVDGEVIIEPRSRSVLSFKR